MQLKVILKRFFFLLKKVAGFCIENIQSLYVYRKIARLFRYSIEIKEADEEDLKDVRIWLHPEEPRLPMTRNPNVTGFVAKKGKKVIGFVEIVRNIEADNPFRGYWIFSLEVRALYRGMGIGELLGWRALDRAANEGAEELSFLMRKDNKRVIKLCLKHGAKIKIIPAIEKLLEKERCSLGYRRVVMSKSLLGVVFEEKYLKV